VRWNYCATEWKKIERRMASPTGPLLIPPGGKDAGIAELDPHPAFGLVPLEEGTVQNNADIASQGSSPLGEVRRGLLLLMHHRTPDGRYLVTRKVHWQAVYRVMVDGGWYDASLGYAGFVDYIRSVAPPGGFRIMPDVETIRHISQTLYARPFRDWRYDAAYGTKRWTYERMRAVAEVFQSCLKAG